MPLVRIQREYSHTRPVRCSAAFRRDKDCELGLKFDSVVAYLLSAHAKHIAAATTAHRIADILQDEALSEALLLDMSRDRNVDVVSAQFDAFRQGFYSR